jgi:hypothetical protein
MARHLIPSDASIKAVKPGDPRQRLNDGDGLHLLLFVKGGAHGWRLAYSFNGARNILSLGTYPDTGLALARRKADEARKLIREGTDPSDVRKAAKAEAERQREAERLADAGQPPEGSFEAVAREWLATVHGVKSTIGEIDAPELLACLRRVESRGAVETAHRVKYAAGQVFRYGIATGRCTRDAAADLRDALTPVHGRHHAAITDPKRAGE